MIPEEVRTLHLESIDIYEAGISNFQEFWSKQNNFLEQCETLLREQLSQLESLKICKSDDKGAVAIKSKVVKKNSALQESKENCKVKTMADPAIVKDSGDMEKKGCSNQTWSIGILSSLLKKEEEIKKDKENDRSKIEDKYLVCKECKAKFVNCNRVLKDHIESVHLKMKYFCKECGKGFRLRKLLFPHIKKELGIKSLRFKDPDAMMLQQCGACPDTDKCSKTDILEHIKMNHSVFNDFYSNVSQIKGSSANKRGENSMPIVEKEVGEKKFKKKETSKNSKEKIRSRSSEKDPNDLTSFISQIESNLQRYSKIIDESRKETKDKKMKKKRKKIKRRRSPIGLLTDERGGKKCKYCDLDFSGKKNPYVLLRCHVERHHMNMVYSCTKCDFESTLKIKMNDHVDENHIHQNVNKKELEKIRSDCIGRTCYECKDSFSKWTDVLRHTLQEHADFNFQEKPPMKIRRVIKNYNFQRKKYHVFTDPRYTTNLDNNTAKVTKGKLIRDPDKGLLQCPQCRFNTSTHWNLKVHFVTHLGARFTCTICDYDSKTKFEVMEHMMEKHSDKSDPDNRKWVDSYITCACKVCDFKGKSVTSFDHHLFKEHSLPAPPPSGKWRTFSNKKALFGAYNS